MKTWVSLFRGINVGGNNLLPMKDLTRSLEDNGCTNVRTYIQSGNVVFSSSEPDASLIEKRISSAVLANHGFEPGILLLSVDELTRAVSSNPYTKAEDEPKSLHLFFLAEQPVSFHPEEFDAIRAASEEYSLKANIFYLHAPDGIGRSKLAAKAEKLLGVDATARNWRTVSKLLEMAQQQ
jgi:uncharacterized protein (DUF1697 family)